MRAFFRSEASPGIVLLLCALLATLIINSPWSADYLGLLKTPLPLEFGPLSLDKTLIKWINDGLMVIFFLFAGLELKRELKAGALANPKTALLPIAGAVGGMCVPALIYLALTYQDPTLIKGWAVPAATDIAFALGVLALLGTRVPPVLKAFLLALAIVDDMGAIIIIALFYTDTLSLAPLGVVALTFGGLVALNLAGVKRLLPYFVLGLVLWAAMVQSGVHATVAGVLLAATIPFHKTKSDHDNPLIHLEHSLRPYVLFLIMPIFALANGGLLLSTLSLDLLVEPATLGVALGLFLGKPLGILGLALLYLRVSGERLPTSIVPFWGITHLAGIGFTMSLFINELAFRGTPIGEELKLGIYLGSIASGLFGLALLRLSLEKPVVSEAESRQSVAPFLVEDEYPEDPNRA